MHRRMALVMMVTVLLGAAGSAAAGETAASGQLTVDGATIAPVNAAAVWTISTGWNAGEKQLQIIMAAEPVSTEGADRALDADSEIRRQLDGDYVVVTLGADGTLQMVYAYISEGSRNFGFGSGGKAEVTIADGRVAGRIFTEGEESIGDTPIAFDLKVNTAILPERAPGAALPDGGGEAGAAYLALVAAQRAGDLEALRRHGDAATVQSLADFDPEYGSWLLDSYKEMAHKEIAVTGGELFEGWAILAVKGVDWSDSKVEGRVKMVKDGDTWRFVEESMTTIWE